MKNLLRKISVVVTLAVLYLSGTAQGIPYGFTQASGTYTNISSGLTSPGASFTGTGIATNAVSAAITLPWTFTYNGVACDRVFISNNGFISLGNTTLNTAPSATNYTPTSTVTNAGAVCGYAFNLVNSGVSGAAPDISYATVGSDFVVQYTDVARTGITGDRMSFQIRLTQTTNVVKVVYGTWAATSTTTVATNFGQVGLGTATSSFFHTRMVYTVSPYNTWLTSGGAGSNGATPLQTTSTSGPAGPNCMRYVNSCMPASGLTYTFTPVASSFYQAIPYTQDFEAWSSLNATNDVPGAGVQVFPSTGNYSIRAQNESTTNTLWGSTTGSIAAMTTLPAAQGTKCARLHSYDAASGSKGYIDFYLNLSTGASVKQATFDILNTASARPMTVQLSTDGGITFGAVLATYNTTLTSWTGQTLSLGTVTSATCVLRFTLTADFAASSDVGLDNLSVTAPACPTTPTVGTITTTTNSASIPFTCTSCTGNFIAEFSTTNNFTAGTAGTAGSGSSTVTSTVTSSPVSIPSGLTSGTLYYVRVRNNCSGSNWSSNSAQTSFTTAYPDLTFSVTRTVGSASDYQTLSGATVLQAGSSSWDDQVNSIPSSEFNTGNFDNFFFQGLKVTSLVVSCNGHIAVNSPSYASGVYLNNLGATTSSTAPAMICPMFEDLYNTGVGTNAQVRWRRLAGPSGNDTMVIEWVNAEFYNFPAANLTFQARLIEGTNQIIYSYGVMQILDGTNSSSQTNFYGGNYSLGMRGFLVSNPPKSGEVFAQSAENTTNFTYHSANIANKGLNKLVDPVDCYTKLVFTPGAYTYINPIVPPLPSNDAVTAPITIVPFATTPNDLCGTFYSTFRATSSGILERANVSTTKADDDVWFTFNAISSSTNIVARGGGGFNPVIELFDSATLNSLAAVNAITTNSNANNTETLTYPTTPGVSYLVRVYNQDGGTQAIATATVVGGVITAITTGTAGAGYYNCYGGASNTEYPTVIIQDATGIGAVVDPTAVGTTASSIGTIAVLAGGSGYSASPTVFIQPPGSGPTGQFSLIILATPSPPANDTACNATVLIAGTSCSYTTGSTKNATPSANQRAITCGNADDDVWYKFQPGSGQCVVKIQGGAAFNPSFALYDAGTWPGVCDSLTLANGYKGCTTGTGNGALDSVSFSTLDPTHAYLVRVWHNGIGSGTSGLFDICIQNMPATCPTPVLPVNGGSVYYNNPTLSWSVGGGSVNYDVYLSTTQSLVNTLNASARVVTNGTARSYVAGTLTAGATYYWTVIGKNAAGSSTGCLTYSFVANRDLLMPEGNKSITYTTCGDTIYDNGGRNGFYKELTRDTAIICPSTVGKKVKITLTAFDIDPDDSYYYYSDDDWGDLQVFNGSGVVQSNNFAGSGNYYDNYYLPPTTFTSTSADGCLTLRTTNAYNTYDYDGFAAAIECVTQCSGTPTTPVASGDTSYCGPGTSRTISISGFSTDAGITHFWYRSNDGVNYTPTTVTSTGLIATSITATRWYKCLDSCTFSNQKVFSNVVVLTVNPLPVTTVSASAVYVCPSSSSTLTASGGGIYAWSAGTTPSTGATVSVSPSATTLYTVTVTSAVGCKATDSIRVRLAALPVATITANPTTSVCKNDTVTLQVPTTSLTIANKLGAAATTTNTTGITPYSSNYEGSREQYLVRASELTALGYRPGKITSLGFNVTSSGSGGNPQINFTIKMGHTSTVAFSGAYLTPTGVYTTVYSNASESAPPIGLKIHTFSTPFVWDGTSNILLDICHDNDLTGTCSICYSSNSTVAASTTSFNSVYGRYNDDAPACGVIASTAITTFTTRPDMTFTQDFRDTVRWAPAATLYRNALANLPYTTQDTSLVYAKTLATQIYTATITSVLGCKSQPTKTVTVNNCSNVWSGLTSNSWNTNTNWSLGLVPNSCADDVQIPDVTLLGRPQPVITTNVSVGNIYLDSKGDIALNGGVLSVCKDWVQNGGVGSHVLGGNVIMVGITTQYMKGDNYFDRLTINNSSTGVTNNGNIRLNTGLVLQDGDFTNTYLVTLKSSATGTAYLDNFTYAGTAGTYTGDITSERYNSGTGNGGYSASDFHYLTSPVATSFNDWSEIFSNLAVNGNGQIIPLASCDANSIDWTSPYGAVMQWNEAGPFTYNCSQAGWYVFGQSGTAITKGRGYTTYLKPGQTVSVTGTPTTGNVPVSLTNSGLTPNNPVGPIAATGQNLVGNPYPSPYQWDRLGNNTNIGAVAYAWQATSGYAGTYQPIAVNNTIAVAQGFMVLASTSGTYNFQQNKRQAALNPTFYKNQNGASLVVEVAGNTFRDRTEVAFNDQSSPNFDFDYDGYKMMSKPAQPTLYTGLSTNKMLSINMQPSIAQAPTVPMGMYVGTNGNFNFTFDNIASFDPTTYIFLEDKKTATMQDMRANNSYSFVGDTADAVDRFVIHFTPPMEVTTTDASCTTTGSIKLEQPGTASWTYTLKDNGNNTVSTGTINSNTPSTITAANGVYTLDLVDAAGYSVSQSIQVNGAASIAAAFSSSANSVHTNEAISVTNTTAGASSYTWDFGDGSTPATTATASHSYAAAGTYTVTLYVTNAAGCQSSVTRAVTVSNATGIAEANANTNSMNIFSFDDKVIVDFSKMKTVEATVQIYNLIGQELSNEKHVGASVYTKELNEIDAAYVLVRVKNSNGQMVTKKVFISNSK